MRGYLVALVTAFQFLTVMPPLIRRAMTPVELGRAVSFFPMAGLLLGLLLAGLQWATAFLFPAGVVAFLVLAAWIFCTGALHFDGFLDSCDGLFGGWTVEDRLRILHDVHVGAFAVAGGALLLLGKYAALAALTGAPAALIVAPALGRWAMSMAVVRYPYARTAGLGRAMKDETGWPQALLATAIAGLVAVLFGGWTGIAALAIAGLGAWLFIRFALARLPGLTGDIYGATCEFGELLALLVFVSGRIG